MDTRREEKESVERIPRGKTSQLIALIPLVDLKSIRCAYSRAISIVISLAATLNRCLPNPALFPTLRVLLRSAIKPADTKAPTIVVT